jgi:hypothetical protein
MHSLLANVTAGKISGLGAADTVQRVFAEIQADEKML